MLRHPITDFERAIRASHLARSRLLARERICENVGGDVPWTGEVLVFELINHPSARLCYAWEADGEIVVVLREGRVKNGWDAVRSVMSAGAG